jgi:hypothetical protein
MAVKLSTDFRVPCQPLRKHAHASVSMAPEKPWFEFPDALTPAWAWHPAADNTRGKASRGTH